MADVEYVTDDEVASFGISSEVTAGVPAARLKAIRQACSAQADGYLRSSGRIKLPLSAWGIDLKMAVAKLCAWELMTVVIGHNPDDPNNFVWRDRRDEAIRWLEAVAGGKLMPVGIVDAEPTVVSTGSIVATETTRGWSSR